MNPYVALMLLLIVAAFAMSARLPGRWSAVAWLAPVGVAVFYFIGWLHARQPPESGDNQRGLVALVGVVAGLLTATAAGLGRLMRRRGGGDG